MGVIEKQKISNKKIMIIFVGFNNNNKFAVNQKNHHSSYGSRVQSIRYNVWLNFDNELCSNRQDDCSQCTCTMWILARTKIREDTTDRSNRLAIKPLNEDEQWFKLYSIIIGTTHCESTTKLFVRRTNKLIADMIFDEMSWEGAIKTARSKIGIQNPLSIAEHYAKRKKNSKKRISEYHGQL